MDYYKASSCDPPDRREPEPRWTASPPDRLVGCSVVHSIFIYTASSGGVLFFSNDQV